MRLREIDINLDSIAGEDWVEYPIMLHGKGKVIAIEGRPSGGYLTLVCKEQGGDEACTSSVVLVRKYFGETELPYEAGKYLGRARTAHGTIWLVFEPRPPEEEASRPPVKGAPAPPASRPGLAAAARSNGGAVRHPERRTP